MTVTFDASASAFSTASTNLAWTHTAGSGADRIAVVGLAWNWTGTTVAMTLNGGAMTKVSGAPTSSNLEVGLWYSVSPPSGSNDVSAVLSNAARCTGISASFDGIKLDDPIGVPQNAAVDMSTSIADTVDAEADWMVVDIAGFEVTDNADYAEGAGQTLIVKTGKDSENREWNAFAGMSYEAGAATVEMSWSCTNAVAAIVMVPIKVAIGGKSRGVKYFHDINDPGGRIYDELGRVVDPWELKPNNWIRVTGLFLPTSTKYASFTQDPELAYIEEVAFSVTGGLRIKTNRGEMTEVLLARAAGGKTL